MIAGAVYRSSTPYNEHNTNMLEGILGPVPFTIFQINMEVESGSYQTAILDLLPSTSLIWGRVHSGKNDIKPDKGPFKQDK